MQFVQRSMAVLFCVFFLIMKFEYMAHAGISQVETYFIGKLVEVSGPTIEEIYAVSDRQTFNVFNLRPFGLEAPSFPKAQHLSQHIYKAPFPSSVPKGLPLINGKVGNCLFGDAERSIYRFWNSFWKRTFHKKEWKMVPFLLTFQLQKVGKKCLLWGFSNFLGATKIERFSIGRCANAVIFFGSSFYRKRKEFTS